MMSKYFKPTHTRLDFMCLSDGQNMDWLFHKYQRVLRRNSHLDNLLHPSSGEREWKLCMEYRAI